MASVMVGEKISGSALRFGSGSDSGFGEHFGDELHALAMIVTREILRDGLVKESLRALSNAAAQFSSSRVVIDFPAGGIRRLFIDPRSSKPEGICIDGVAAAVNDMKGMIRNSGIQIGDAERPAIFSFCVVIFKTEDPFASRRFCSTLAQRRLNGGNRT